MNGEKSNGAELSKRRERTKTDGNRQKIQQTNKPTNKPTNQQTNQQTNKPTNKPTNQQTNKPTNKPTNQQEEKKMNLFLSYDYEGYDKNGKIVCFGKATAETKEEVSCRDLAEYLKNVIEEENSGVFYKVKITSVRLEDKSAVKEDWSFIFLFSTIVFLVCMTAAVCCHFIFK